MILDGTATEFHKRAKAEMAISRYIEIASEMIPGEVYKLSGSALVLLETKSTKFRGIVQYRDRKSVV